MFLELTYWPGEVKTLLNVDRIVAIRPDSYSGTLIEFADFDTFHASEHYDTVRAMLPAPIAGPVSTPRKA